MFCAESDKTDKRVASLEAQVREIMGLPEDHRVRFTDLHDALTSMRFHGKPIPQVHPRLAQLPGRSCQPALCAPKRTAQQQQQHACCM